MKEYLKAQKKTTETVLDNAYTPDELDRFSRSDYRWADNRNRSFRHKTIRKGEIYQFEFGKNMTHTNIRMSTIPPTTRIPKAIYSC